MSIFLFFFFFFVYIHTCAPVIVLHDSGEIVTCIWIGGVTHPPGYPFFCILGKLFSFLLPIANIGFRVNILNSIFGALAIVLVFLIIYKLSKDLLGSLFGSFLVGFSKTFWLHATIAEKYMLNSLFLSLLVFLILHLFKETKNFKKIFLLLSFFLGLSFSHHFQTLYILPCVLVFLIWSREKIKKSFILPSVLLFFFPLTLYFYIPLRALYTPALCWNYPVTLERFLYHLSATEYKQYKIPISEALYGTREVLWFFFDEFYFFVILSLGGLILLFLKDKKIFFLFLLLILTNLALALCYKIHNIQDYYLPSYVVLALCSGYLLVKIPKILKIFLTLGCLILFLRNEYFSNHRYHFYAYDFARNVLRGMDFNSVCFVKGDTLMFPCWYVRYIEEFRRDISLIDIYGLKDGWYLDWLRKYYGIDIKPKGKEAAQKIKEGFEAILNSTTSSIYLAPEEILENKYKLIPATILHKIKRKQEDLELVECDFYIRYLEDRHYKSERTLSNIRNHSVAYNSRGNFLLEIGKIQEAIREFKKALNIQPDDLNSFYQLGVCFLNKGELKKAKWCFERVKEIYPDSAQGYFGLGLVYESLGKFKLAEENYKRAIKLDPNREFLHRQLESLYAKMRGRVPP